MTPTSTRSIRPILYENLQFARRFAHGPIDLASTLPRSVPITPRVPFTILQSPGGTTHVSQTVQVPARATIVVLAVLSLVLSVFVAAPVAARPQQEI